MYRLRLQYTKQGDLMYISHLDLLKVFERSLKRANIDVKYSEGFNPRPLITFAHPLSLGIESTGEICEIETNEYIQPLEFIAKINESLPSGIEVVKAEYMDKEKKSLMSKVYSAIYMITFSKPVVEELEAFMNSKNIMAMKRSKTKTQEIDIKPYIMKYKKIDSSIIELELSTGSNDNLKPDLLIDTFIEAKKLNDIDYSILRTKILMSED